jgi:ribosomal subunit interface protein
MTAIVSTAMNIQVAGRQVDLGEALRTRITDELQAGVGKYFERGGSAEVTVVKDRYDYHVDIILHLPSGQQLVARAHGGDAHSAFSAALDKVDGRIRRYKRRVKNHHAGVSPKAETAALVVLRAPAEDEETFDEDWGFDGSAGAGAPQAAIIAETEAELKTLTVSMAVMELDLTGLPAVVFRSAGHGGISVVYRRPDGNIGWIDPQRTGATRSPPVASAQKSLNGAHSLSS